MSALWFAGFADFPTTPQKSTDINVLDFVDYLLGTYSSAAVSIIILIKFY